MPKKKIADRPDVFQIRTPKGTHTTRKPIVDEADAIARAKLIHRIENGLVEVLKNFEVIHRLFPRPSVGMGATLCVGSDRYPATITYVSPNGKQIKFREDNAIPDTLNGYDYYSKQVYMYTQSHSMPERVARLGPKNGWLANGIPLAIGVRCKYIDPHF